MSFPPPCERGSAAEDLAYYFHPSTPWTEEWYAVQGQYQAPPLRGNGHIATTASWSFSGNTNTLWTGVFFSDLSMCWYTVAWNTSSGSVQRSAQYLPRPAPWPRDALVDAHETYGETVAAFAEGFEGTGQPCARGECWDLAAEALKYVAQFDYVPRPVQSISRAHGHLIYAGWAKNKGAQQAGRWRGGDDRVRRGDILEWRSARVSQGPHGWSTLGNPDHTAVIVRDMVPRASVSDGLAVRPADMGELEVMEQGVGSPPKRATYELANFEEGEVWIYRPVGMEAYVGCILAAKCPDGVNALSI